MKFTINTRVHSRTYVDRVLDAAYRADEPPAVVPPVPRARRGGRQAGTDATVCLASVSDYCEALSVKSAEVVRFVASRESPVPCSEVRAHLSRVFYNGELVSARRLGGIMANGGRSLRVNVNGELWRPIQLDPSGSFYLMDPRVRTVVADSLGPPVQGSMSSIGSARDSPKS